MSAEEEDEAWFAEQLLHLYRHECRKFCERMRKVAPGHHRADMPRAVHALRLLAFKDLMEET